MTTELNLYVHEVAEELIADLEGAARQTTDFTAARKADRFVAEAMDKCLASLAATGIEGRANAAPSAELWKVAGHLLERGDLQRRARVKPHGYAGDYEMLRDICENHFCGDPLGRALDVYFQSRDAPQAVRGRTQLAAEAIARHRSAAGQAAYRLASVGAGPAIDLEQALVQLAAHAADIDVTLLDLDPAALDAARQQLATLVSAEKLHCVRENLFRLARNPNKAVPLAGSDFILCLGLFDYLEREDARAMLRLFWKSLSPGGMLMVANFTPHCQARPYMEWVGNWYLIYRTREELADLVSAADIPDEAWRISAEPTGANLLLTAEKRK